MERNFREETMKHNNLLSLEAICKIVGLDDNLIIDHEEMGKRLKVTFFPYEGNVCEHTRRFYAKLKEAFIHYGVTIVPFEEALIKKDQKAIKKGIHLIVLGEQSVDNMPIEYLTSYRDNLILTVIDDNKYIAENFIQKGFKEQADYGLALITWHFSNFVVGVDKDHWIPYGSTGLNDVYKTDYAGSFNNDILKTLISKLYAPINPLPLSDFKISKEGFSGTDPQIKPYLDDLVKGSKLFMDTGLMSYRFTANDVPFKKDAYRKLYTIMLDNRTSVHFGYISRQLPTCLSSVYLLPEAEKEIGIAFGDKDYTFHNDELYIKLMLNNAEICLKVPEIHTLTSISGADKVNMQYKDIVKMGLNNGKMTLQFEESVDPVKSNVRPSFDTKVILSNAVATSLFASILKYVNPAAAYPNLLETNGIALGHWHGYFNPDYIPRGWEIYGGNFPVFMCSAQQAAAYGFIGKSKAMMKHILSQQDHEYCGDIHIEPDHGVNITWESLTNLAYFLRSSNNVAKVGTEFFPLIKNYSTI
ncbi:MAG TPA: hypothetical protein PKA28_16525 [Methylomusa anaerophila]|uniref:Uncharacterized protein n=1 Tax=Methylomusa anaerophila TaxID=1930071 RepID=A0A348AQS4_9FIRM|nr:hypothetical protein [Methylomusa anaerophila]BBB93422.1 hypothetical protein MAMMFC1_04139 [Methylomusa anaerophila]HML90047.1 hypothetical protein [Methylomusa anaerophila]